MITVLLDNEPYLLHLKPDWGLSLYVERPGGPRVLMDTGGSFEKLTYNARALGLDLARLDAIFISHWHGDHCGALPELLASLGRGLPVFVPKRPGWSLARELSKAGAELLEAREPVELLPGFWSTGDLGGEHALVIDVPGLGLVTLSGCSHPGPKRVVEAALAVRPGRPFYALIGGFHIFSLEEGMELGRILSSVGAKLVCPCHCTGLRAKEGIMRSFSGLTLQCGVGRRIEIGQGSLGAG